MKYNININQFAIIKSGVSEIDLHDAAILDFIKSFMTSTSCKRERLEDYFKFISPRVHLDCQKSLEFPNNRELHQGPLDFFFKNSRLHQGSPEKKVKKNIFLGPARLSCP